MFPALRRLRKPFNVFGFQKVGIYSQGIKVHLLHVRTFISTLRVRNGDYGNIRDTQLYQQLAANPAALRAIKEFLQFMKERGNDFLIDQPPSMVQMIKLMSNSELRSAVEKLRNDLGQAGVDVNPANAIQMLKAFRPSDPKPK